MARVGTTRWDVTDHLAGQADRLAYLDAALETGEASVIAAALGDVARAAGMARVAADARLGRESLYKALSADGNPELATVLRVMRALGFKLRVDVDPAAARAGASTAVPTR